MAFDVLILTSLFITTLVVHPERQAEKYVIPSLPQTGSNMVELQLDILAHVDSSIPDIDLKAKKNIMYMIKAMVDSIRMYPFSYSVVTPARLIVGQ